jgi:hypothetical protein
MAWESADARRLMRRAEELRQNSDSFGPENRKMLLQMAEQFERIARDAETGVYDEELSTRP